MNGHVCEMYSQQRGCKLTVEDKIYSIFFRNMSQATSPFSCCHNNEEVHKDMWQTEQKVYYGNPSETPRVKKRVKVQFSSLCRKKSQIHSKAGSSGFARILSQMCSFLRGSKLSSSLTQVQELEVGLTRPEGQITNSLHQTSCGYRLTTRTFFCSLTSGGALKCFDRNWPKTKDVSGWDLTCRRR